MRRLAFAVPGALDTPTGGYAYDRRMIDELRGLGWVVDVIGLGNGFPHPDNAQKQYAQAQLAAVPHDVPVVIDGLALGALPEAAHTLRGRTLVALVHHPLALETGLSPEAAHRLRESERAALTAVRAVIVNSASTRRALVEDYGVAADRITVALPGTDRATFARGSDDGIVRLLAVGTLVPRKGYDILIAALADLPDLPWRLTIAGDRRDPPTAERIEADIAQHRLGERVTLLGAVRPEQLSALYLAADLFVLASRFEGYGMAYAEAMAHGLPVIGTTGGAIPDTVPPQAGLLVAPDDVPALRNALRRLIGNAAERQRYAAGARQAATQLATWSDSARTFAAAVEAAA